LRGRPTGASRATEESACSATESGTSTTVAVVVHLATSPTNLGTDSVLSAGAPTHTDLVVRTAQCGFPASAPDTDAASIPAVNSTTALAGPVGWVVPGVAGCSTRQAAAATPATSNDEDVPAFDDRCAATPTTLVIAARTATANTDVEGFTPGNGDVRTNKRTAATLLIACAAPAAGYLHLDRRHAFGGGPLVHRIWIVWIKVETDALGGRQHRRRG
jgi:hypothetical protein